MTGIFKKVAIAVAGLLALLVIAAFWYRGASLPQIDGKLHLAGLNAPVEIVRDAEGIPHIYTKSASDAYFALGFVHAQDRLWQLEMNRRIVAGRLAEILGESAVNADRFLRALGVRRNAERIYSNLSPETRTMLDAYAHGVNAYLAERKDVLPPEFLLTGAPAPELWQPADSIGWQTMMAWDLGANWTQELLRMRLAQRLSLQQINEFLPPYPGETVLPTRDYTKLYRELAGISEQLAAVASIAPPSYVDGMGSNNWVVAGALSQTGKPLLANDPHLGLSAPALWYFAHLSAPGMNVIGATLPGIPTVVLGRTDRIAWGFTNTGPDVQDLYIERIHPANNRQYQTPDGWADFTTRTEIIKVKGKPDVTLEVRETRHGPVISGVLPIMDRAALDAKRYAVAFAWTALRPDDLTLQSGIKLNRARNWEGFLDAAKDFSAPQQNMVYADIDGNIGFVAPGRVPVRKPENDLKGLAPALGWDARYDWAGFVPFDALPRQFNPPAQRIVTANQKIVADDYPYFLTSEWTLPYRAVRIGELLDATPRHGIESFAAMQKDDVSLAAQELLPILRKTAPKSQRAQAALALLAGWNGAMDAGRSEPLIFNAWLRAASYRIFADELGDGLMKDYWDLRNAHRPMVLALQNKDGMAKWCADVTGGEAGRAQTCDEVLSASLETALNDLERRYGGNMAAWRWGEAHVALSEHRPFSKVRGLATLFDIRVASPGDSYTVNVGRYNLRDEKEPFVNHHAASLRALYDLSNLENSRFMHSTGQSGNVLSPLYRNYAQRWADVAYVPMKTRREEVEKERLGMLTLLP
ncbi:penicillin acylase family protein [Noviherbaspirillum autotrophicum]|uniref:Acyl-homoserine lactone acylase n=1 Tax=Noviherbaspirillum autotrophicum TaxID=709839 RepID=A0A0C1YPP6_9BURK|nr:penicillin acylase family protein [Noviherbaspirillum autotrophicum]KIF82552.1 acyl-homoserine lactone acylase [Noviherbaspirillum autotrophicum]